VVVDTATHHPEPAEVVQLLRVAVPDLERAGIKLAIENHDRFKVHTLVDILEQVSSVNVGICLDTVNSFGAGEGPEAVIDVLGPYVINLHIKDFTVRRHPSMLGFEVQGTPAGHGMLNIPWLLNALSRRDFNGILELWTPPESDIEQSIRKENDWALESIRYLRTLIKD
jgi:3-oxoisoapionate decarboxylase